MTLPQKLAQALNQVTEIHSEAFERFANAFLLQDYPELEGLGAKKDKGMDARIVTVDGKNEIVFQSCVSPPKSARTKVLGTWKKLHDNPPHTLVYCTPGTIGLSLDDTRKALRSERVSLQVCDATWFTERVLSSPERSQLSEAFAQQILYPLLEAWQPNTLYSALLSDVEEVQVIRYLELHSQDRRQGRNLTKAIFEAFILGALNDARTDGGLTQSEILEVICRLFPEGHHARIHEIVPHRIVELTTKGEVCSLKTGKVVLSKTKKERLKQQLESSTNSEVMFRAHIANAIRQACNENEIDYDVDYSGMAQLVHSCILWYMREQGKQIQNPISNLVNILNTEELVLQFIRSESPKTNMSVTEIMDIAPSAVYYVISKGDKDTMAYLRVKSDIFVSQAFLQATPDIQKACKKLFGQDVIYVDTTALIHCTAELYDQDSPRFLLRTLETARSVGIKIKTFRPFIEEFVAHLRGPVLLEWRNHFRSLSPQQQEQRFKASPRLLEVFARSGRLGGPGLEQIVEEIVGLSNRYQNATDFVRHEFKIEVEEVPGVVDPIDQEEWALVYESWLGNKRRYGKMEEEQFEVLVQNDVNAYTAVKRLRGTIKVEGTDYGYKVWLLTMDRMYWRIVRYIGKADDYVFHVAMSMDYLANCVATLASLTQNVTDPINLPATLLSNVGSYIPSDLREEVAEEFAKVGQKRYLTQRKIRELVQEAKNYEWDLEAEDMC
ncbi:hypothetical protein GCM10023155_47390 [Bremerella cremea]